MSGNDNSGTNTGFDDPQSGGGHGETSDSSSHGGQQKTDWKKKADEMVKEYLASCPGSYETTGNFGNTSPSESWNPLMNESGTSLSDTEGEESIYPVEPSENRDQHLRCVFHLFLEEEVESVKIQTENPMLHGCITMNLDFCHTENHWISPELFIPHDKHDNFRYRYVVKYKEGVAKWLWKKVTFRGNDDKTLKEAKTRKLNNGRDQYDIFRNPHNKTLMNTIFRGQLFYVKWLYQKLSRGGDLKEVLMECEHVGFGHPSYSEKDIRIFFHWVVESTGGNMADYHCVYLCSLLGQFVSRVRTISAEYCCRMLEDKVIDRLLSRLELCSFEALPKSTSDFIKIVAEHLFKRGSSKGYLIFINFLQPS